MNTMCVPNRTMRRAVIVCALLAAVLCLALPADSVFTAHLAVGAAALALLAFLAVRKQFRPSLAVLVGSALLSVGYFALHWASEPVWRGILLSVLNFPFYLLICVGLRDALAEYVSLDKPRRKAPTRAALLISAGVVFAWTAALLVIFWTNGYYPYGQSPDTVNQWDQIHGVIQYSDVHTMGHTMLLRGLLAIYDDYITVIIFHIAATAALYALFAYFLMANGIPVWMVLIGVTIFNYGEAPLFPVVYPWKDLPYSLCVGGLTLLLMRDSLARLRGAGRDTVLKAILYGLLLASVYLLRRNGILILIFVGLYLLVEYLKRRKFVQLAAMLLACALLLGFVNWLGYSVMGFKHQKNGFSLAVFGSGIAAAVNDGTMSADELAEVDAILPVDWMQKNYGGYHSTSLIWNQDQTILDPETQVLNNRFVIALGEHSADVIRLYLRLLPRHWPAMLTNIAYSTTSVWGHLSYGAPMLFDNVTHVALFLLAVSSLLRDKKRRFSLTAFAPVFWNMVSIAISAITNETRYLFPSLMLAPFLLMYGILIAREQRRAVPAAKTKS